MLYLEDYLEMIEHLPQELRDRFTEMREMDLSVQNNIDSLDKRARTLFQQCRRGELVGGLADSEFHSIRKDYYRVLEDSDEKVQLAGQMYDLVDRYLRRLDSELYKFKCELEADHNGITEILEKRSLELDSSTSNGGLNQKENRYFDTLSGISSAISGSTAARVESRYNIKPEKRRESSIVVPSLTVAPPEKRQAVATASGGIVSGPAVRPTTPSIAAAASESFHMLSPATSVPPRATASSVAYNLQQFGAGNAIAAAASQAIAQTQQMQQGRRTASLKASYEAIHGAGGAGTGPHDLLINNRELAGATHNAIQAVERETSNAFSNQQRRHQKKKLTANTSAAATLLQAHQKQLQSAALNPNLSSPSLDLLESPVPGVLSGMGPGPMGGGSGGISVGVGAAGGGGGGGGGGGIGSSATTSGSGSGLGAGGISGSGIIDVVVGGGGGAGSIGPGGGSSGGSAHTIHHPGGPPLGPNVILNENGMVVEQTAEGEWTYDPNEPRYCICNQVSYGDMVACDNEDCPFEWFHYPCVNITSTPKGKWYCPQCSSSMKRRASRKN